MLRVCENRHLTGYRNCPQCLPMPKGTGIPSRPFTPPSNGNLAVLALQVLTHQVSKRLAVRLAHAYHGKPGLVLLAQELQAARELLFMKPGQIIEASDRYYQVQKDGSWRRITDVGLIDRIRAKKVATA